MTKKKIFDIVPPQPPQRLVREEKKVLPVREKPLLTERVKTKRKSPILITIGAIVIIGGLSFWLIEPKAEIEIWPKIEAKEFSVQTIIAGEIFQIEKSLSQDFPATGTKLKKEKAHGIIRVYNNYSTYDQPLVATTRFVSNNGKLFRTPKRIVVPGGHYEGGELIPGTIDIEVVADQLGEEYNIGPATFSIPGFAGTPKYTAFYAKSFESMQGGVRKETSWVSQDDLDRAQEVLTAQVLKESKAALEGSIPSADYISLEGAFVQDLIEFNPLAKAEQELESFTCQVKARTRSLVLKKLELEEFAKGYILSQIPEDMELNPASLQIKYSLENIDLDQAKLTLDLELLVEIYSSLDETALKEILRNKPSEDIKALLKDFPEINKVKIELWPFWAARAPEDFERIEIKLRLDPAPFPAGTSD